MLTSFGPLLSPPSEYIIDLLECENIFALEERTDFLVDQPAGLLEVGYGCTASLRLLVHRLNVSVVGEGLALVREVNG